MSVSGCATGNRTGTTSTTASGVSTSSYTYPTATSLHPHAVQSVTTTTGGTPSTVSYGYDAAGDTTTRLGETLTYDPEGRLATVTDGSDSQSNIYDADGDLLLASDAGDYTLYLGATELHKDAGSSGVCAVRTYSFGGTPVAERTTTVGVSGSVLRWLGTDAHNTATIEVVASTGVVTVRYADPYGNPRGTTPAWSSGHGFLNADSSDTSGTLQLGARAYDPVLGRFLSVDAVLAPLNPLQNNGYSYAAGDPVTGSDPSGDCYAVAGMGCVGYVHAPSVQPVMSGKGKGAAAAPGGSSGGYVAVTPHVLAQGPASLTRQMKAAYSAGRKQFGMKAGEDFSDESQEVSFWIFTCISSGQSLCPDSLKEALASQTFAPSDKGLALQAMIIGGGAFFFINGPGAGGGGIGGADESDGAIVRSFSNPDSMVGATEDQVRAMIPQGMTEGQLAPSRGVSYGRRWLGPGRSGQIEFSYGNSANPDLLHQEPYVKVSIGGTQYRAAAAGSSLIGTPGQVQVRGAGSTGIFDLTPEFRFGGGGAEE